ncbi:nuclear transport factor 2 family protein [Epilithonimonas arachidiradicis]|uniref:Uncharacterized protein DUF4440 n=1 Tax=Epilithonimonas arachidiradicis TaxID=1617282 RepID=A0A420DA80_9FLAO|nr:nuclear transport factor 2 family protein [Epilithonimonas arachidiradicis]RKE88185.1 uncharacterized protein DUF4440 [Epilithonimonas arachidiradicis]GGG50697.1 hypothetical protein GCM10007332_10460 [Epilithonimonas arachidiradicis]
MKKFLIALSLISFLSVFSQSKTETDLLETDKTLARLSTEKGIRIAFDEYLSDNPTAFPFNKDVLTDRVKILNGYAGLKSLEWVPLKAEVSESGDLGYTYGIGKITVDDEGKAKISYSHYISIWKKDNAGKWKLILDTGNDCSEEVGKKYFK